MYDSVFTILENFNNQIIKNNLKIKNTIINIKKDPSNLNFEEYRRLRQNENKILNSIIFTLRSEDCKISDYALRLNLNDFIVYKGILTYQITYNFQKISIYELLSSLYTILKIDKHFNDIDQMKCYKTILELCNIHKDIKMTLIIFNEQSNVYFPIYIN